MKILFPIVEFNPITNYGELGVSTEKLITRLNRSGQEIYTCLPFYKELLTSVYEFTPVNSGENINISGYSTSFWKTEIDNITFFFVKNEEFFTYRKNIYGYPDDNYRFVFYSLAVIE